MIAGHQRQEPLFSLEFGGLRGQRMNLISNVCLFGSIASLTRDTLPSFRLGSQVSQFSGQEVTAADYSRAYSKNGTEKFHPVDVGTTAGNIQSGWYELSQPLYTARPFKWKYSDVGRRVMAC